MWESVWFMWFRHAPIYHMLGRHMTAPNGWQFATTIDSSWHSPHIGLEIPCEVQNLPVGQAHVASHLDAWATTVKLPALSYSVWHFEWISYDIVPQNFGVRCLDPKFLLGKRTSPNISKSAPIVGGQRYRCCPCFVAKTGATKPAFLLGQQGTVADLKMSVEVQPETDEDAKKKTQGSELPGTFGSHGTCYVYCYQLFLMLLLLLVLLLFHC